MSRDPAISVFRPDRPGIRKVLGDLEAEIMETVWSRPANQGTTVRDVFAVLYARRGTAYTTVMSTMARLERKGLLEAEKSGAAFVYRPRFTQEEFIARFVGRILENLLVSFSGVTLERLSALTDSETADRVQELLTELARRRAAEEHQQ